MVNAHTTVKLLVQGILRPPSPKVEEATAHEGDITGPEGRTESTLIKEADHLYRALDEYRTLQVVCEECDKLTSEITGDGSESSIDFDLLKENIQGEILTMLMQENDAGAALSLTQQVEVAQQFAIAVREGAEKFLKPGVVTKPPPKGSQQQGGSRKTVRNPRDEEESTSSVRGAQPRGVRQKQEGQNRNVDLEKLGALLTPPPLFPTPLPPAGGGVPGGPVLGTIPQPLFGVLGNAPPASLLPSPSGVLPPPLAGQLGMVRGGRQNMVSPPLVPLAPPPRNDGWDTAGTGVPGVANAALMPGLGHQHQQPQRQHQHRQYWSRNILFENVTIPQGWSLDKFRSAVKEELNLQLETQANQVYNVVVFAQSDLVEYAAMKSTANGGKSSTPAGPTSKSTEGKAPGAADTTSEGEGKEEKSEGKEEKEEEGKKKEDGTVAPAGGGMDLKPNYDPPTGEAVAVIATVKHYRMTETLLGGAQPRVFFQQPSATVRMATGGEMKALYAPFFAAARKEREENWKKAKETYDKKCEFQDLLRAKLGSLSKDVETLTKEINNLSSASHLSEEAVKEQEADLNSRKSVLMESINKFQTQLSNLGDLQRTTSSDEEYDPNVVAAVFMRGANKAIPDQELALLFKTVFPTLHPTALWREPNTHNLAVGLESYPEVDEILCAFEPFDFKAFGMWFAAK